MKKAYGDKTSSGKKTAYGKKPSSSAGSWHTARRRHTVRKRDTAIRRHNGQEDVKFQVRSKVAVLEWRAWSGFLLTNVLGDHAVRIETDPFREFPPEQFDRVCDLFPTVCFHINLSVRSRLPLRVRDLTDRFVERGIYVVNGLVQDIRKSTLQAHLEAIGLSSLKAARSGPADEILFVKTDLNYGGNLERRLSPESIAAASLEPFISPDMGAYHYKTVERRVLQESIWTDPSIVIEKYVTNSGLVLSRLLFRQTNHHR